MSSALQYRRIVIKVGTSVLTAGTDRLHRPRMVELIRQIAMLRELGGEPILVTSGAGNSLAFRRVVARSPRNNC